jgi:hypothetical protein
MLGRWCDEDDPFHWLLALGIWSVGACAGWIVVWCVPTPEVAHWPAVGTTIIVSLVTIALQYPVLISRCPISVSAVHLVWLLGLFAQLNWVGFFATRVDSSLVATVVITVCLSLQAILTSMFIRRGKLTWLWPWPISPARAAQLSASEAAGASVESEDFCSAAEETTGQIQRKFVDGLDALGVRYVSGVVYLDMAENQRTESFVVSFCPALNNVADVELECEAEELAATVDHATEAGARIVIRRQGVLKPARYAVAWYATASQDFSQPKVALP